MILSDYEMMSPAERETAIRQEYTRTQKNINDLVCRLAEEYRAFEYLGELMAEIEVYGADDLFCQPKKHDINASKACYGYIF